MSDVEVAVVGGGPAGLACAEALREAGSDEIVVLEKAARCGGPVETVRIDGCLVERGPSTVRRSPDVDWLLGRAGLEPAEARRAAPCVAHDGELLPVPPPVTTLLTGGWIPLRELVSALAEPLRAPRPGPRSVHEWVAERLGHGVASRAADLLTLGSFGAPADRVGFESAFPELADRLSRSGGRLSTLAIQRLFRGRAPARGGMLACEGGLGTLVERLGSGLGARLRTDTEVHRVLRDDDGFRVELEGGGLRARRVVLAVPPAAAAPLLDHPAASGLLDDFRSTPQTLATLRLDEPETAARWTGLGFLCPTRERLPLLGCLFPSSLFPDRAPAGTLLLTAFLGPGLREASGTAISAQLGPLLRKLLGAVQDPQLIDVARHPGGIPLYDREHRERMRSLRAVLAAIPGLQLAGWGYDGIGLGAAIASGRAAARRLAQ